MHANRTKTLIFAALASLGLANVDTALGQGDDPARRKLVVEIVKLTNKEREKAQLPALKESPVLTKAAQDHSDNMAGQDVLEHKLDGKGVGERLQDAGYEFATYAENVAMGQRTAAQVVASWMSSPGHRKNILNPAVTEIGVGVASNARGSAYYTQKFSRPLNAPVAAAAAAEEAPAPEPAPEEGAAPAPAPARPKMAAKKAPAPAPAPAPARPKVPAKPTGAEVVKLVNAARVEAGLEALAESGPLKKAAQRHAQSMADQNTFDDGLDAGELIKEEGYMASSWSQNVTATSAGAKSAVDGWMNSEELKAHLLGGDFADIGVGAATTAEGQTYFVLIVGKAQE